MNSAAKAPLEAAEKRVSRRESFEKHPSGPKGPIDFSPFTGVRAEALTYQSCPFKTMSFSAACKALVDSTPDMRFSRRPYGSAGGVFGTAFPGFHPGLFSCPPYGRMTDVIALKDDRRNRTIEDPCPSAKGVFQKPVKPVPFLYACVHAADFPAQALLRLRPELRSQPAAILEGRAPLEFVCSLNRHAQLAGAARGMTRVEAEHIAGLRLLPRSPQTEAAARAVVLECAANFAPQTEDASNPAACACVLDIAGTERLFGPPEALAQRLRAALDGAGFRASVVVSSNFHAARLKAAASRGVTVIPPGAEAAALASLPIGLLDFDEDAAEIFANWGIRTLGELGALPESDLVVRLGDRARTWHNLALGVEAHTFEPVEAAFALEELCDFDAPVERADSLLFLAARMIDCLAARAAAHALALASLKVRMTLEGGGVYRRVIRPAVPTLDRKFLLKLLQLEFAAHPPQAAVMQMALAAEAGHSSKVQLGLFTPQTPEPSRLDVTLARLKAIAGEDRVGTPVLEDTHRQDSFHVEDFAPSDAARAAPAAGGVQPRAALRRMRPPAPVRVYLRGEKPAFFRAGACDYTVSAAYGPWRSSGCWWAADAWDREEWDVLAEQCDQGYQGYQGDQGDRCDGAAIACLLVHDRIKNQWRLEAFYD